MPTPISRADFIGYGVILNNAIAANMLTLDDYHALITTLTRMHDRVAG